MPWRKFTKLSQAIGPENIGSKRRLPGLLALRPVLSPSRITLENNGKIRPQPYRENAFARASGGGNATTVEPSLGSGLAMMTAQTQWRLFPMGQESRQPHAQTVGVAKVSLFRSLQQHPTEMLSCGGTGLWRYMPPPQRSICGSEFDCGEDADRTWQ